jgi:hypothetical protein
MVVTIPLMVLILVGQAWPVSRALRQQMAAYSSAGAIAEEVFLI